MGAAVLLHLAPALHGVSGPEDAEPLEGLYDEWGGIPPAPDFGMVTPGMNA
jgi:hypothetical protein